MMNFGRGFPIVQESGIVKNGDSWVPVTPGKPILQGNRLGIGNWQELVGLYGHILQEPTNHEGAVQTSNSAAIMGFSGRNHNRNVIAAERNQHLSRDIDSYVQNVCNDILGRSDNSLAELLGIKNAGIVASANETQNKSIYGLNRLNHSKSYTQVANNLTEPVSTGFMFAKQSCTLGSNQRCNSSNSYSQVATNWTEPESTILMLAKQNHTLDSNQRLTNFNSYTQVASNWTEPESTTSMLEKQNCTLGSNQRLNGSSLTQLPNGEKVAMDGQNRKFHK